MKEIEEQIILDVLDYLPGWTIHPISRPTNGQPRTFLRNDPLDPHKDFEENEIHFGRYDLYDGVVDDNQSHQNNENNPQLDDTINNETSESSQQNTTLENNNITNQETTPNTYTKQYKHKPKHKQHSSETYDPEDYNTYNTRKHIPPHEILQTYKKTIYQAASYLNREKVPNTQICYHAIIMWTAGKLQEQYNNNNENPSNLIREAKEMIIPYYNPNYHGLHTKPRIRYYDPFMNAPHHHHHQSDYRNFHDEEILKHLYDDYMYMEPVTGERGDVLKINCELRGIEPEPGDKIKFIIEE